MTTSATLTNSKEENCTGAPQRSSGFWARNGMGPLHPDGTSTKVTRTDLTLIEESNTSELDGGMHHGWFLFVLLYDRTCLNMA